MSRLQSEPERFRHYFCRALNLMAFAIVPFIAVLAALAHEVIFFLLGPSWDAVAVIFQALALAGIIEPFTSSVSWVMVATGRVDRLLHWALATSPAILLSFFVGLPWGSLGVALAYACTRCLLVVPSTWFALRGTPVRLIDVLGAVWRPFCLSAILFATVSAARFATSPASPLSVAGLSLAAGIAVCLALLVVWRRLRAEALGLLDLVRQLGRGRSAPEPVLVAE
jgi:PST family polysaccharide transporter